MRFNTAWKSIFVVKLTCIVLYCAIDQCDAEAKLPALYLLDSVSKNVGEPFLTLFSKNLPEVISAAIHA